MTYQYTHGYGVVVTSAGETDEYGNIVHIQKDIEENGDIKLIRVIEKIEDMIGIKLISDFDVVCR